MDAVVAGLQRDLGSAVLALRAAAEQELAAKRFELCRREEALNAMAASLERREAEVSRRELALKEAEAEFHSPSGRSQVSMTPTPARSTTTFCPAPEAAGFAVSRLSPRLGPWAQQRKEEAPWSAPAPSRLCSPSASPSASVAAPSHAPRTAKPQAPTTQAEPSPAAPEAASAPVASPRLSWSSAGTASRLKAMFESKQPKGAGARQGAAEDAGARAAGPSSARPQPPASAPKRSLQDLLRLDEERRAVC